MRLFERPSLIFLKSIEDLIEIQGYIMLYRYGNQPFKHFVFIPGMTFHQLESSWVMNEVRELDYLDAAQILQAFFIINEIDYVKLATIEWYSEKYCNSGHLRELNHFNKNFMKWKIKLESYEKFLQYHGCELVMLLPLPENNGELYHSSGFGFITINDELEVHGLTPVLFEIASSIYNFTAAYQPAFVPRNYMSYFHDQIALRPLDNTIKKPVVFFEAFGMHITNVLRHRHSNVIANVKNSIFVTPGEAYTPYEKLFLPFDLETWILLLITFSATFVVISIINRFPKSAQNIIYGQQDESPALNVVKIYFGISQTRLPERSFSRTVWILFIFFCLIFRTCYQSKLFDFMTSKPRRPPPKSVKDLIDMNYMLYDHHVSDIIQFIQDEQDRSQSRALLLAISLLLIYSLEVSKVSLKDYGIFLNKQSQNASSKIALVVDEFYQNYLESVRQENYDWNYIKDYAAYVSYDVVVFQQFSFYFRMMKKTIDGLIDTGVIKHLVEEHYTKKRIFRRFKEGPKILTVSDLAFGFNIWLGFCGISLVAFLIEILCSKKKIKANRTRQSVCESDE